MRDCVLERGGDVVCWEGKGGGGGGGEVGGRPGEGSGGGGRAVKGRDAKGVPDVDLPPAVWVHALQDHHLGTDHAEAGDGDEGFIVKGEGVCRGGGSDGVGVGVVGRYVVPGVVSHLVGGGIVCV